MYLNNETAVFKNVSFVITIIINLYTYVFYYIGHLSITY